MVLDWLLDEGFLKELREIIWNDKYPLFIGQILDRFMEDMNELAVAM